MEKTNNEDQNNIIKHVFRQCAGGKKTVVLNT